jgi:hypothetical protein
MTQRIAPRPRPSAPTPFLVAALGLAVVLVGAPARAQDRADVERSRIVGNRELPKVLYIVPWKKPLPGDLSGRPPVSVIDEALAPIDRDVFRRELQYGALASARQTAAVTPSTSPTPPSGDRP